MMQPVKRETIDLTGFDSGSDQGGLEDYSEPHLDNLPTRPERRQQSEDGLEDLPLARRMRAGDEDAAAGHAAHSGHDSRPHPRQPKPEAQSGTLQTIMSSFPALHAHTQRNGMHHSNHASAPAQHSRGVTSLGQSTEAKQSAKPINGTKQQDASMLWPAEGSWCAPEKPAAAVHFSMAINGLHGYSECACCSNTMQIGNGAHRTYVAVHQHLTTLSIIGRPRNGKRQAPLDLVTVGGTAPPPKKPALSKLKGLIEREGLNPAPDKRRVPLRQQPGGQQLPQPRPRPRQLKSVYDIPSLAGQPVEPQCRPGSDALPRPSFAADKYPAPAPPLRPEAAAANGSLRPEDAILPPPPQPRPQPAAAAPAAQQPLRRVVQLSPSAVRQGSGPAWIKRRAGAGAAAPEADNEVTVP